MPTPEINTCFFPACMGIFQVLAPEWEWQELG